MPDNYVTIGKYFDSVDAELARIKLEAAGIPVFLADDAVVGMKAILPSIGGVRLQVPAELEQQALEVLAEGPATVNYEGRSTAVSGFEDEGPQTRFNKRQKTCPACGAERIERQRDLRVLWLIVLVLLMAVPLLFTRHKWRCLRCGHRWKAP